MMISCYGRWLCFSECLWIATGFQLETLPFNCSVPVLLPHTHSHTFLFPSRSSASSKKEVHVVHALIHVSCLTLHEICHWCFRHTSHRNGTSSFCSFIGILALAQQLNSDSPVCLQTCKKYDLENRGGKEELSVFWKSPYFSASMLYMSLIKESGPREWTYSFASLMSYEAFIILENYFKEKARNCES